MVKPETRQIWHKNFIMVLVGQIVSLFGNAILRFALPLYLLEISGSPTLFGTVLALSALPMIILSPIGGVVADRVNKKRIMVTLDFIGAIAIVLYMLSMEVFSVVPATVVVMMALFGIQALMTPAVDGSIPLLISADQLVRANSVVFLVHSLSGMLGPAVGGILFAAFGIRSILVVSSIALALAAIMEMFIRIPDVKQEAAGKGLAVVFGDIAKGLRFIIKENPLIAKISIVIFFLQVTLGAFAIIGIPVMITQSLKMPESMVGIAQAIMGAGGILGGILAGVLGNKLRIQKSHLLLLAVSALFIPLGLAFLFGAHYTVIYIILVATCLVVVCMMTLVSIRLVTLIQAESPPEMLGKVMALFIMLSTLGLPFGQFIYGILFEQLATLPWLVIFIAVVSSGISALNSRRYFKGIPD